MPDMTSKYSYLTNWAGKGTPHSKPMYSAADLDTVYKAGQDHEAGFVGGHYRHDYGGTVPDAVTYDKSGMVGFLHKTRDVSPMPYDWPTIVLSAISPMKPLPTFQEDVELFTRAVSDVATAARDGVLTEDEADALVGELMRGFAGRRGVEALAAVGRVPTTNTPTGAISP